MPRKPLTLCLICMVIINITAQTNKTFFLGHSLINFEIPNIVDKLSISAEENFSYDANIGIGASLSWHWVSPSTGQGSQWHITLPNGGYENFILTEAVPLSNHLSYSNTYRYVDSLCTYAEQYNPNIQFYIYETWHCTNSGNGSTTGEGGYPCSWDIESNTVWRERLDNDLSKWESIADSLNLLHSNPMYLIPGGQALGRLSDLIDKGSVPGLTSVFDLFVDEYHLDSRGNYFIACVMYSVIHAKSPVGLSNHLTNQFGTLYDEYPTPEQAMIMQQIAWETVCEYQRDGVSCNISNYKELDFEKKHITITPIPAEHQLILNTKEFSNKISYKIYNSQGNLVLTGIHNSKTSNVNISMLNAGIYLFVTDFDTITFIKQ